MVFAGRHGVTSPIVGVDTVTQFVGIRPKDLMVIFSPYPST